jgi:hypothetical protein
MLLTRKISNFGHYYENEILDERTEDSGPITYAKYKTPSFVR